MSTVITTMSSIELTGKAYTVNSAKMLNVWEQIIIVIK